MRQLSGWSDAFGYLSRALCDALRSPCSRLASLQLDDVSVNSKQLQRLTRALAHEASSSAQLQRVQWRHRSKRMRAAVQQALQQLEADVELVL